MATGKVIIPGYYTQKQMGVERLTDEQFKRVAQLVIETDVLCMCDDAVHEIVDDVEAGRPHKYEKGAKVEEFLKEFDPKLLDRQVSYTEAHSAGFQQDLLKMIEQAQRSMARKGRKARKGHK
jgi:deoxyhypusine synthase